MKFKALTVILATLIFALTGEAQDPITLRLVMAIASAGAISAIYCSLTEDRPATMTATLLAFAVAAATAIEPDPSILQSLLAFLVCPIIALIVIKQELGNERKALVEPAPQPTRDRDNPA